MKPTLLTCVVLAAVVEAAMPARADDPVPTAADFLHEIRQKWLGTYEVDGNYPDLPVVKLGFSNCHADEVNDEVLAQLKLFPKLRELTLNSEIVSHRGLVHLQELPELRKLVMHRVPLTDKEIASLKRMPQLKELILFRIELSREGLQELKRALPQTTISWRGP
jgi:hypothetical protein